MSLLSLVLCGLLALSSASALRPDERIVNGEDAKEGEIPYQVSLQYKGLVAHFCGGSILNRNYVITAAHCVSSKLANGIQVFAGMINLAQPKYIRNVEKVIIHEEYSSGDSWKNDIALLKVAIPFPNTPDISFVPLPSAEEEVGAKDVAVVSGWGALWTSGPSTTRLQRVNIFIAEQEYCKFIYNQIGHNIYDSHICAFDPVDEKGSCHGDSGGPLTVDGKLIGLVSWARDCALTDYPTVFTRVTSHLKWIEEKAV